MLVSTVTFCGAVHAIGHAGLQPVLVDVEPLTGMPSPTRRPGRRTPAVARTRCSWSIWPATQPPCSELTAAAGLTLDRVVEDAAHALGTWVGDRPVGSLSRATCFSFYATKNLPIGEGGMVTTDDDELRRLLPARQVARDDRRRLAALPAGRLVALHRRRSRPEGQPHRPAVRDRVGTAAAPAGVAATQGADRGPLLAGLRGPGTRAARPPAEGVHAWHLYVVRVGPGQRITRDGLAGQLAERGIGTSVHFIPLHTMAHFRATAERQPGGLPVADALFEQLLSLPLHPALTDDDVDRVIGAMWSCVTGGQTALVTVREEGGNR